MLGADYQLTKLLGYRPSVKRQMIYQQGCFTGGTVLHLAKDLTENNAAEVTHEFPAFFPVYKDGRVECYPESPYIIPSLDPGTGIEAKDILISSEPSIKARVFMLRITGPENKLPLVIVVSVDYRLTPENPLPIPYEDSWASMQ
ncbi:hypothetical protein RJ639_028339 [Escallonia herrerae]|uniref:Uncharacterized protein n=1 Tax=Escallonia herrerae TaxID=1293975 RepID=A0AA89BJA6_9ASTE|nr:hypothetical protein RJ639_028339 [Escallonia herrerae]